MTTEMPRGHTPGPWEADPSNLVYAEDGTMIVDCSDSGSGEEDADRRAGNARLIALAPALLAELRALEWAASVDVEGGGYEAGCPSCDQAQRIGHYGTCALRAVLRAAADDVDPDDLQAASDILDGLVGAQS